MPYTVEHDKNTYTIKASAPDMKEVFAEGARGVMSVQYDIERLKGGNPLEIAAQGTSIATLFQSWIQEILDRAATNDCVPVEFEVHAIQKLNEKELLLTGTMLSTTPAAAKEFSTKVHIKSVHKGSGSCKEGKEDCQCSITVTTS